MEAWFASRKRGGVQGETLSGSAEEGVWAFRLGLGLFALGIACRLYVYLLSFPIWRDEASLALNLVARDFRGLLGELDNYQVAPLLFLWMEKAVCQYLGSSAALLRLVPLLAGVTGLMLFWHLSRRCLSPLPAALAVGCLAVAQSPIHLAATVKPYSLDLLCAALLLTLAIRYLRAPDRQACLVALALVIPFAVAASYPVVFVAGAVSLVLLPTVWRQGGAAGRRWFVAFNVLCGAAFVAHLLLVGRQVHDPETPAVKPYMALFWKGAFLPREPLSALGWVVRCHVGHLLSYPVECNGGGLLGLILAVLGARALYRQGRRDLLGLCLIPFALNFVAAALRRYPYAGDQRLEQHLVPGLCLLLGSGLTDLIERLTAIPTARRCGAALVAGTLVFLALAGLVGDSLRPYHDKEATWARDIARHLRRELRAEDQVVLRQSPRCTLDCLRWHLLPFAEQMCSPAQIDWTCLERAEGRLWLVGQTLELVPLGPEPPPPNTGEMTCVLGEPKASYAIRRTCFRTRVPGPDQERVYLFCCDLHVLARRFEKNEGPGVAAPHADCPDGSSKVSGTAMSSSDFRSVATPSTHSVRAAAIIRPAPIR